MKSQISAYQTLHGYSNGHRLLAGSFKGGKESKRLMLYLSDLSGDVSGAAFRPYITGYPILEENCFAFARTWPALEMGRPGCVWTHTLLIPFSDIPILNEASTLLPCLVSPADTSSLERYETALTIDMHPPKAAIAGPESHERAAEIVSAFYTEPERPMVVVSDSPNLDENLILALWLQQWDSLRRSMTFCTGSFRSRTINKRPFELQMTPAKNFRKSQWAEAQAQIVNPSQGIDKPPSTWERPAARELALGRKGAGSLSSFLSKFGTDLTRADFRGLVEVYSACEKSSNSDWSLRDLTSVITRTFPKSGDARLLKQAIYGQCMRGGFLSQVDEYERLAELTSTKKFRAFDSKNMDIQNRAASAWRHSRQSTKETLRSLGDTSFAGQFLKGVAFAVKPRDLISLDTNLLLLLANEEPSLLEKTEAWERPARDQKLLLQHVESASEKLSMSAAARAALRSDIGVAPSEFLRIFRRSAVSAILDCFAHGGAKRHSNDWLMKLGETPDLVLDWLSAIPRPSIRQLATVARILDPLSDSVRKKGAEWADALAKLDEEKLPIELAVFTLALGFGNRLSGPRLVSCAFETVYEALVESRLADAHWQLLTRTFPPSGWYSGWYRSSRLLNAAARDAVRGNWPAEYIHGLADDRGLFERLLQTFMSVRGGKRLLRRTKKWVQHNEPKNLRKWKQQMIDSQLD